MHIVVGVLEQRQFFGRLDSESERLGSSMRPRGMINIEIREGTK